MAARRRTTRKKRTAKRRTTKRRTTRRKRRVTRKKRVKRKKRVTKKKKRVVKRKKKRVSIRGTRSQVWRGSREKVKTTGQTKSQLMKNKNGKVVSKKAHAAGLRAYKRNGLEKWTKAFVKARENLGLTGFVACKKGSAFHIEATRIYKA